MLVEGIISNSVSQDIRQKGHLSIRFTPDGFSVLISDASYKPVLLKQYVYDSVVPGHMVYPDCRRILDEHQLLSFEGETVMIMDLPAVTFVPDQFFNEEIAASLLEKAAAIDPADRMASRYIPQRRMHILFAYPGGIEELKEQIKGKVQVIHSSECLISLSDQVQASDHQRGFILAEVQQHTLNLLIIRADGISLINWFALKDPSDFIYHTLNTMKQLNLNRESIPVYLSGIVHPEHELFGLLGKYVRIVKITPYYLEELTKTQLLRFMILSEGSKCA
ncbi:MAG: DUF3822 family protein [Bacteroidota bacterium]